MTDVWATFAELDEATQRRMADVLEMRGADPKQRDMREEFLAGIAVGDSASLLEVGCGTGVLTRVLAGMPGVESVVGVDLAPSLLDRARDLAPDIRFEQADARSLPFADGSFDLVVFDSTLSHVPEPERALAEAARVLRPGGWLAAFDGDYATTTVALGDHDPLQICVEAMMANSLTDRRVMRRLSTLVRGCGLELAASAATGMSRRATVGTCSRSSSAEPTCSPRPGRSATTSPWRSRTRPGDAPTPARSSGTSRT